MSQQYVSLREKIYAQKHAGNILNNPKKYSYNINLRINFFRRAKYNKQPEKRFEESGFYCRTMESNGKGCGSESK